MFEVGRIYNRQQDIHDLYGGQRQGGISTPQAQSLIFLFTGASGEQYGYKDGWDENEVFLYTGEGQRGEMTFRAGNKAIRDHLKNGKELHLFERLGKSKGYRYLGMFVCPTWEWRKGPDVDNNIRDVVVFHLIAPDDDSITIGEDNSTEPLRERAFKAATEASETTPKESRRRYYERSAAVHRYVLHRANGVCESCALRAPFLRKDSSPYLEPHHTRRLSDGGPDDPRYVGAICPNCHREIHYGAHGETKNQRLIEHITSVEQRRSTTYSKGS